MIWEPYRYMTKEHDEKNAVKKNEEKKNCSADEGMTKAKFIEPEKLDNKISKLVTNEPQPLAGSRGPAVSNREGHNPSLALPNSRNGRGNGPVHSSQDQSGHTQVRPQVFSPVFNPPVNFVFLNQAVNHMATQGLNQPSPVGAGPNSTSPNHRILEAPSYYRPMKRPRPVNIFQEPMLFRPQTAEEINDEIKRVEKNKREKQRRQELNGEIKRLGTILKLSPHGSTEKVIILRKAADELERLTNFENQVKKKLEHPVQTNKE